MKKLRYYFLLLNFIKKGAYPTREVLLEYLQGYDIEISERTLYRAIKELKTDFGVEVKLDVKRKGYFIPLRYLDETNMVLNCITSLVLNDVLANSQKERVAVSPYIEFEDKVGVVPIELIQVLFQAMIKNYKTTIKYHSQYSNSVEEHLISPLFFKQHHGVWFLVGKEGRDLKCFEMERVVEVIKSKERFKENIERIRAHYSEIIGLHLAQTELQTIVLSFDKYYKNYLESIPLHHSQELTMEEDGARFKVNLKVRPNEDLKQIILRFGKSVKVEQPMALREEIIGELRRAIEVHV
ncbi:helix-turn-helix transcriptional regulator [Myroides pelagicus]|uniref:WYL domain-containing protein n=1 Tax=Myroides pelagicus TaxID=270914 RepID=A0A7K1GQF9_9FLAO|nr:WYL domain-containing protein [Myroides pelagicus]MEC4113462.1 WYL domain-containing protein [Myroides pelagicus]MTH31008.1 WYL domain-containing protein [Myroides pelagicus]